MHGKMKVFRMGIVSALLALLTACGIGGTEVNEPHTDSELSEACQWIQGGGKGTTGGKGGTVYIVSTLEDAINLEDNKPESGTLRAAVEAGGARTILFTVSGTIHLLSLIHI